MSDLFVAEEFDDSATDDPDEPPPNPTGPLAAHPRPSDDDSATEDESDPEEDLKPVC